MKKDNPALFEGVDGDLHDRMLSVSDGIAATDLVALLSPQPPERGLVMHELIYCEDAKEYESLIALIKAEWPQAVFEDGSDMIHEDRFAVTIAGVEQDDFFRFAMKNRFATCCLGWNIATMENGPRILGLWKSLNAPTAEGDNSVG